MEDYSNLTFVQTMTIEKFKALHGTKQIAGMQTEKGTRYFVYTTEEGETLTGKCSNSVLEKPVISLVEDSNLPVGKNRFYLLHNERSLPGTEFATF